MMQLSFLPLKPSKHTISNTGVIKENILKASQAQTLPVMPLQNQVYSMPLGGNNLKF